MTEDLPQRPINPYGESKLMFEKVLIWYQQLYKLEFIAFPLLQRRRRERKIRRTSSHRDASDPEGAASRARPVPQAEIFGTDYSTPDGTCIRDYIHILDLAQAHILGLQPGKTGFYNLGNGDGYSVREVIQMCEKVTGKKITAVEKPGAPATRPNWWPPPKKRFANWLETENSRSWKTSSPPPGPGTKNIRPATRIDQT